MAWAQLVSDIPNDLSLIRGIGAVAVDDQVYLFGYNKSGDKETMQVLAFSPATFSWRAVQPLEHRRRDGSTEDASATEREETVLHFAVASEDRVFVCVGGREDLSAHAIVFDTRRSRWSGVRTSGDLPSGVGYWRVRACEYKGHVYVCNVDLFWGSSLWALDLSSLRWTIVGSWKGDGWVFRAECLLPLKNRLYMLLIEETGERTCEDYVMMYFDLATNMWEKLNTFDPALELGHWTTFILQEKMYILLREKRSSLRFESGEENAYEIGMKYSFARNRWERVRLAGVAPADSLDLVCTVNDTAVFFSFERKKAYVLDFFPSLSRLCFEAISKYQLDASLLPTPLQRELVLY